MVVQQMLHGYDHGHNLLATSVDLSSKEDLDRIFEQSDWDEYSAPFGSDSSYITCYPLKVANYYVVAKSWYADEMERPGCVWTQSLLLDLGNIDQIFNFEELLSIFKRPKRGDYKLYSQPIFVDSEDFISSPLSADIDAASLYYLALNLTKRTDGYAYCIETDSEWYQRLSLRLLQYMPMSFLRDISICSGTLLKRKLDGRLFSLQFTTSSENTLMRKTASDFQQDKELVSWVKSMVDGEQSIARLIRIFSADIGSDNERFRAVIKLISMLVDAYLNNIRIDYKSILDTLIKYFPKKSDGVNLKSNFLRESVSKIFCSNQDFIYLVSIIKCPDAFDENYLNLEERLQSLRSEDLDSFQELLFRLLTEKQRNTIGNKILVYSIPFVTDEMCLRLADSHWEKYLEIVSRSSTILCDHPNWLAFERDKFVQVYWIFSRKKRPAFKKWLVLLEKLMTFDVEFYEDVNYSYFESQKDVIESILDYYNKGHKIQLLRTVINLCVHHEDKIMNWIGRQADYSSAVRSYILKYVEPTSDVIRSMDSNLWRRWSETWSDYRYVSIYNGNYYSFMFLLSFNWKDDHAMNYLKQGFNGLYALFQHGYDNDSIWKPIETFLYDLHWWENWDRCKKMRIGIVRYLNSIGKDIIILKDLCDNPSLLSEMYKIWEKECM